MKSRRATYITENPTPIKLLGIIKGGFDVEKKIHKQLAEWHYRGEWFHLTKEVRLKIIDIIKENRDNIEPVKVVNKRGKEKHIQLFNLLKSYSTANGMVDILPHIKTELCEYLEISTSTFTRYINKLCKLKKLKKEDALYYFI